jgi:hypothetical protein
MSLFTEAAKEHVRNKQRSENTAETSKKFQQSFVLKDAIESVKR